MDLLFHPTVDMSDPLVTIIAWSLTCVAGRLIRDNEKYVRARHALPLVAVMIALFLRAAVEASQGAPVSMETVLRGIAAGAVAVVLHSQAREVRKVRQEDVEPSAGDPTSADPKVL